MITPQEYKLFATINNKLLEQAALGMNPPVSIVVSSANPRDVAKVLSHYETLGWKTSSGINWPFPGHHSIITITLS